LSLHEIAVKYAAYLARELAIDQRQELRMAYGLEILLGEIVKLIILVLLSWMLGILPEVFTMNLVAGILRLASGGEHCSEYYRCLVGGTIWFLLLGGGVHYLNPHLSLTGIYLVIGLSCLITLVLVLNYAPAETENKPINSEEERARLRRLSIVITLSYGLVMLASAITGIFHLLILPLAAGMLEQVFTITPWGYGFIRFVDRILDFDRWSGKGHGHESSNS